jgi:hypothetical protein
MGNAQKSRRRQLTTAKVAKNSYRGSKPGERRGGRKKGTPNKKTAEMIRAVQESGITPLDFMLQVMRGEPPEGAKPAEIVAFTTLRFEAAKAAAPYLHPRLSAIECTGKDGGPVRATIEVRFV